MTGFKDRFRYGKSHDRGNEHYRSGSTALDHGT